MPKVNTHAVLQALEVILGKRASVLPVAVPQPLNVRLTLDEDITSEQFKDLAQLSAYLDNWPTIKRSGAGVTVIFDC